MTTPLAGVRVVDMATVVAGPGTAKYIADFGADVIKVEASSGRPATSADAIDTKPVVSVGTSKSGGEPCCGVAGERNRHD